MKLPAFVLGFVTGVLAAYLVLTRLWWPDVRLDAAHASLPLVATAPPPPTPTPFGLPGTPTPEPTADPSAALLPLPSPAMSILPPASETATPVPVVPTTLPAPPPAGLGSADPPLLQTDLDRLRGRALMIPVQGIEGKGLHDNFNDDRGGRRHQAIDIMAPRGTPVLAVGDGRVEKLFTSIPGGLTIYEFDPKSEYCYYYAHLDHYAAGLEAGKTVHRGEVIGYVGSTGNASSTAPHLHFQIFRLGPERRWWEGTAVDAYPLWAASTKP